MSSGYVPHAAVYTSKLGCKKSIQSSTRLYSPQFTLTHQQKTAVQFLLKMLHLKDRQGFALKAMFSMEKKNNNCVNFLMKTKVGSLQVLTVRQAWSGCIYQSILFWAGNQPCGFEVNSCNSHLWFVWICSLLGGHGEDAKTQWPPQVHSKYLPTAETPPKSCSDSFKP